MSDTHEINVPELAKWMKLVGERSQQHAKTAVMLHSRIYAIEDALKKLGISQEYLTERYNEHLLRRQVRDEDLIGQGAASNLWHDEDKKPDPDSDSNPPQDHPKA